MTGLILLSISIIIVLSILFINNKNTKEEGFTDSYYLESCPQNFKMMHNKSGDIICCGGEILGDNCLSDERCVLAADDIGDTPSCVNYLLNEYKVKGPEICPKSMPNYFKVPIFNFDACTSGKLNKTLSGPSNKADNMCMNFNHERKNRISLESCYNQKRLDNATCFGKNCKKSLKKYDNIDSILIEISFTDLNGVSRACYTRDSMEEFLDETQPGWRNKGIIDTSKNIIIAEVAKAYFIDRTLSQNDIQV